MRTLFIFGLGLLLSSGAKAAIVDPANFTETTYVSSADLGFTTGIAWATDGSGRLFVTRKGGFGGQQNAEVRVLQNGAVLPEVFATESVYTAVESGLLGICVDPNFLINHYVYLLETVSTTEQQIIRYTDLPNAQQRAASRTVIVAGLPSRGLQHNGGAVGIGPDGRLYWGIGDQGNFTGVDSDILSLACKIGRANRTTGAALNDNPFFGQGNANTDKIWARGYRNPFSFVFQGTTGDLWTNMVGSTWEQAFVTVKGSHAGFNMYENNQPPGYLPPVISYLTNGVETRTITPAGAVRQNNVATFTTTTPHPFRKGATAVISGSGGFDGSFPVTSIINATQFTVAQTGPNQFGGGGTASTADIGGALTGACFYDSTAFPAAYQGNFFFGDYNTGRIMRVPLDASNEPTRVDEFAVQHTHHIDMATGPDGALYCAGQDSPGEIRRLSYNGTAQNLIVFPTAMNVVEGGASVLSIRLNAAPATSVTVNVARISGDTDLAITSGATLTFTPANYATPQLVTISAAEDADKANDSAVFRVSSAGLQSYDIFVNGIDNDEPQLVLSTSALTVNEGSSSTFTVRLASAPTANVSVTVARTAGDADIAVAGGSALTFTPTDFATPKTVTIAAAEDADNADDTATISVSTAGEPVRTIAVHALDNDPLTPSFTTNPVLHAVAGSLYVYDADAVGNPTPTFSLLNVPDGMTIDAGTGVVNWVPPAPGNYTVTVQATNSVATAAQVYTLVVTPDMPPTATITRPLPGELIFGTNAEFFGDGHDDVNTVRAEFFVDGVLRYTDVNDENHFHYGGTHLQFDTTQFTNGSHLLKMRVTDTQGQTGEQQVRATFGSGGTSPPTPSSAVSRKAHGTAGTFGVNLPLSGTPGVECRSGGSSGDFQVVVTFPRPVSVNGNFQADVTAGAGAIGSGGVLNNGVVTVNGSVVTIPLTNITDAQTLRLMLFNVNDGLGFGDVAIPMSVLAGDTTGNGQVTTSDVSQTKSTSGGAVTTSNFRNDVIANGAINTTDLGLVKSRSGNALPAEDAADSVRTKNP
jgi:glucose/arabinose dehydrogenase